MILLDADILLIDIRYPNDARFATNRQLLETIRREQIAAGITAQALLETVGILSFNISRSRVLQLPTALVVQYGLAVFPDLTQHPEFAGCTTSDLVDQMSTQMSLGDALQAVQIRSFAPHSQCLLSWNARHFSGKLVVPALTPPDWLSQQPARTP